MTKPLRELIGDAASDCPSVHISGDVYELGDFIVTALSAAGLKVVGREPTDQELLSARPISDLLPEALILAGRRRIWRAMFDAAPLPTKENESE